MDGYGSSPGTDFIPKSIHGLQTQYRCAGAQDRREFLECNGLITTLRPKSVWAADTDELDGSALP